MIRGIVTSLILVLVAVGCASKTCAPGAAVQHAELVEPAPGWPASALAFDPPVCRDLQVAELSRDGRGTMAFLGFQQAVETTSYSRIDDRQSTGYIDSYDRHNISVQVGTSSR